MGGVPGAARAVQHEAAIDVHGTAAQHRLLADANVLRLELHLGHDVAELHAERLVQHDAESGTLRVLTDQHDRLSKIALGQ